MKTRAIIIISILIAGAIILVYTGKKGADLPQTKTIVGLNAPEVSLRDNSGNTYTLSALKGSVLFINFWASWCAPCKAEMPSIQALYARFRDEKRFRMLTILYNDDYSKAVNYMKENRLHFPLLTDPDGKTAGAYGITGVPETYIVDKKGILKKRVLGPEDWNSPRNIAFISGLINE